MSNASHTPTTIAHNGFDVASGRDVAALQDPRPACIIGARSDVGEVGFATVIWVTPLSHNPAMVAFALREKSHTMGIIRETGRFSISIPPADEEGVRLIEFCGTTTGRTTDKGVAVAHRLVSAYLPSEQSSAGDIAHLAEKPLTPSAASDTDALSTDVDPHAGDDPAHATGGLVPVLSHCYSWEVGTVDSVQPAGDHLLVIGTITHAETRAARNERGQLVPEGSLLCVQHGHYASCKPL